MGICVACLASASLHMAVVSLALKFRKPTAVLVFLWLSLHSVITSRFAVH